MAKKTIVGEVAGTVSDAVASAIDALAHPMDTAAKARRALGHAVTSGKRKVVAKEKVAKKAAKKVARKSVSRTRRAASKAASGTRRAVSKTKSAVRKAAKKATKRIKRR